MKRVCYFYIFVFFWSLHDNMLEKSVFKHDFDFVYLENNTWVRGNTRFISSVENDISRVSAANE